MRRIVLALLTLVALLVPSAPPSSVAAATEIRLRIPYISQYQDQPTENVDCGPASIAMIAEAYGRRPADTIGNDAAFITHVRSLMGGSTGRTGDPAREQALAALGLTYTKIPRPTSAADMTPFLKIEEALAQGKPIVMRVAGGPLGRNYGSGFHAIAVVGISADRQRIFVHDPDNRARQGSLIWLERGGIAEWSYSRFQASVRAVTTAFVGHIVGDGLVGSAYKADFASQQFNATMRPGETQTATITVKNSGTATWDDATNLVALAAGDTNPFYDAATWRTGTRVASGAGTAPGQTKQFSFTLRAPAGPGIYKLSFALVQEGREFFSQPSQGGIWFMITVVGYEAGCAGSPPLLRGASATAASPVAGGQVFGEATDLICPGDFNGDGRVDLLAGTTGTDAARRVMSWRLLRSTGFSFRDEGQVLPGFGEAGDRFFVADFNGDGREDLVAATARGNEEAGVLDWYVMLSTAEGWRDLGEVFHGFGRPEDTLFLADMTRDGKADIVAATPREATVAGALAWYQLTSTGGGVVDSGRVAGAFAEPGDVLLAGDITGDGKADILAGTPRGASSEQALAWYMLTSVNGALVSRGPLTTAYGETGDYFTLADVDGDGARDVIAATARTNGDGTLRWYASRLTAEGKLTPIGSSGIWYERLGRPGQRLLVQNVMGAAARSAGAVMSTDARAATLAGSQATGKADVLMGELVGGELVWTVQGDLQVFLPLVKR